MTISPKPFKRKGLRGQQLHKVTTMPMRSRERQKRHDAAAIAPGSNAVDKLQTPVLADFYGTDRASPDRAAHLQTCVMTTAGLAAHDVDAVKTACAVAFRNPGAHAICNALAR